MADNAERWYQLAQLEQSNAALRRLVRELQRENSDLRVSREVMAAGLHESRQQSLYLPEPGECKAATWTILLRVGELPELASRGFDEPLSAARHYRLMFERQYGYSGDFWRVMPFCTEPRRRG